MIMRVSIPHFFNYLAWLAHFWNYIFEKMERKGREKGKKIDRWWSDKSLKRWWCGWGVKDGEDDDGDDD